MNDRELLKLYRNKRAVDGLNGRTWNAIEHYKYDEAIEKEERRRQLHQDGKTKRKPSRKNSLS